MSIKNIYHTLLTKEYIMNQLRSGQPISAAEIETEVTRLITSKDLSVPQFTASGHYVASKESASASKFNSTMSVVRQDLHVLYQEMLSLSQTSINSFERWNLESTSLERRLINLEDRVTDLLLLAQDTEGYHSVIIDDFVDLSLVDQTNTTALIDLGIGEATMGISSTATSATKIFYNSITNNEIRFRVRNIVGFTGQSNGVGTDLTYPFLQDSRSWWTTVHMNRIVPVTCELAVKLGEDPIDLSKIYMELHDSVQSGPMTVTPMYSIDNVTFFQLPTNTFSQEMRTSSVFSFPAIQAKWIKFLLTKTGPDPSTIQGVFDYQFGFKKIEFYNNQFDPSVDQVMISKPLYVLGQDSLPVEFSKLVLETCERIESNTNILYDITVSNDSTTPVDSDTVWTRISPLNRTDGNNPNILDVGDIDDVIIGDTETVQPSYSAFASGDVNPSVLFQLLSVTDGSIVDETVSGLSTRYQFINPDDRILNYQIKDESYTGSGGDKLDFNESSLIVFRNTGEQGITPGDITKQVRGIQKGWGFEDPYYSCVVEVVNPEGVTLGDVGPKEIIIDDAIYTGTVDSNVMTGKTASTTGIHRIQVHKNNWKEVTPNAVDEDTLKNLDPLYPFNHKLLIEGYQYPSSFTDTEVYNGIDLFAEMQMQNIGTFDFLYNTAQNNFKLYTLDRDASGTHTGGNESTRVFLVKVDEENPDFQNEQYVIRFKLLNDLRSYLRLRATFITSDQTIAPSLDSYKIKLA